MKNFLPRLALALLVTAGMIALTAPSSAQQHQPNPNPQQPTVIPQQAQQQAQPQSDAQTQDAKPFNGTIMKVKGTLILKDTATNVSYQLDDQEKAKQFEGKQVKVVGKLDLDTNLIHVETIEPLAS